MTVAATRAPFLLLLLPLAACVAPAGGATGDEPLGLPTLFGSAPPAPPAPPLLPPAVLAALPPGVPPSVVLTDAAGCYLYSIERTDPPSGYPLRDAAGNQICEGGGTAVAAASPPLAPPATLPDPSPETLPETLPETPPETPPVTPAAAPAEPAAATAADAAIDITPVLEAPLPAGGAAPGGLVGGSITPPAPIVQPN